MVTDILAPAASPSPTYLKVANYPGLYRHARSGRYYGCKKLGGVLDLLRGCGPAGVPSPEHYHP